MSRALAVLQLQHPQLVRMVSLPGGAGIATERRDLLRLSDLALPGGGYRRLDLRQTLRVLLDVLAGLGALHTANVDGRGGFVHGEISPREICIDEEGRARLVPVVSAHLGAPSLNDSSGYAAPEKLLGDETTAVSDVYSVGVLLWEALAGRRLFLERTLEAMVTQALGGKQPRPDPTGDDVWALPLVLVSERAIAVDPAARYESAAELAAAIEATAGAELWAPRRSRASSLDLWQEEIPTSPLVRARDELPPARSSTPPPAVLDLRAFNTSLSPRMIVAPEESGDEGAEPEADVAQVAFVSEPRSKALVAILVAALAAAAALLVAFRPIGRGGAYATGHSASRGELRARESATGGVQLESGAPRGSGRVLPPSPAPLASSWAESFGAAAPAFSAEGPSPGSKKAPSKPSDVKSKRPPPRASGGPDPSALRYGI